MLRMCRTAIWRALSAEQFFIFRFRGRFSPPPLSPFFFLLLLSHIQFSLWPLGGEKVTEKIGRGGGGGKGGGRRRRRRRKKVAAAWMGCSRSHSSIISCVPSLPPSLPSFLPFFLFPNMHFPSQIHTSKETNLASFLPSCLPAPPI